MLALWQWLMGMLCAPTGLHRETRLEAEEQLRVLAAQLPGTLVQHDLALLQGRMGAWLERGLGLPNLAPSVRCGLEGAVLTLLAAAQGRSLTELVGPGVGAASRTAQDASCGVTAHLTWACTPDLAMSAKQPLWCKRAPHLLFYHAAAGAAVAVIGCFLQHFK